jgi:hypothetical protein
MAKDGGSDITSILLMVGGAAAAYWYITSYGPNGAVSAGNVSWWTTWFGGTAVGAPVTVEGPATVPVPTPTSSPGGSGSATGSGTPPITPVATPTPVIQFPANFTVASDINNSLKGTVLYNGVATSINVIPSNAGNATGVVWNSQGQDITATLGAALVAQIVQAFQTQANIQSVPTSGSGSILVGGVCANGGTMLPGGICSAPAPAISGVNGIVPAFQSKTGPGLGQGIPSMSFGKGFGSGFSNRRKSTPPLRQLLN